VQRFGLIDDAAFDVDAFLGAAAAAAAGGPSDTGAAQKETEE
jgi:hypothetical protein